MDILNGLEGKYVVKNNKHLRYGYTTGSCAAAAAKAGTIMLLQCKEVTRVDLMTPKGISLHLKVEHIEKTNEYVSCAVKKDAGDDPDVTDGAYVYAKVQKLPEKAITIEGGLGVGRITKHGLSMTVGSAAINPVPRKMIHDEVAGICEENDYAEGIYVEISIPEGVALAKKTFNSRLGIEGGISVLGTSGIVEPMSESALIASIEIEMKMLIANGAQYLIITPGNYGEEFSRNELKMSLRNSMKCSNYLGETIDLAVGLGVKGILFISHIGKFIKVAGGIMNTHSRSADARAEIMAAHTILAGGSLETAKEVLACITSEEAIDILEREKITKKVMESVTDKIHYYLNNKAYDKLELGAIIFSNKHGQLGQTKNVESLLYKIDKQENGHN